MNRSTPGLPVHHQLPEFTQTHVHRVSCGKLNVTICCSVAKLCLTLCNPMDVARQAPLSMGFLRQEYWSGLPFPPPRDLLDPGTEPVSPELADGFFYLLSQWEIHEGAISI